MVKVRAVASALLAGVLALGIAGCSFTNGNTTLPRKYDPSDGVGANVGDLDVRNALLVSDDGTRGSLVVSVVNKADERRQLAVQYVSGGDRETINLNIPARSLVSYGADGGEQIVLENIDTEPGALFPVYFASGNAEGSAVRVPVLDTTLAEYDGLQPSPSPTPVAPPVPTPVPVPTPTPGTVPQSDNTGGTQPGDSVDSGQ